MSIWNKILLGLNFVAALAFLYLGMRTLKTHQHWRELADQYEKRVDKARQREDEVRCGYGWNLDGYKNDEDLQDKISQLGFDETPPAPQQVSLREAQSRLHELVVARGRVWRPCQPDPSTFDQQTGAIRVAGSGQAQPAVPAEEPAEGEEEPAAPSWIPVDAKVYVFEEYKPGDWTFAISNPDQFAQYQQRYLGEFRVKSINEPDRTAALEPVMALTDEQKQRVRDSMASWVLYEKMPVDSHEAFEGLTVEQLRAILPAHVVDQYVADGTPVRDLPQLVDDEQISDLANLDLRKRKWNPPPTETFDLVPLEPDEVYRRPLRDYAYLFPLYHEQTALTDGKLQAVQGDLWALQPPQQGAGAAPGATAVEPAIPKMEAQVTFREGQLQKLDAILTRYQTERDALVAQRKRLEDKRDELKGQIELVAQQNWQMAVQITQLQRQAAEQINARTQSRVARSESAPSAAGSN